MYRLIFKRIFDIIFAAIALLFLLPVFLIVALLIQLESRGPVFFLQDRLGEGRKLFRVIKFRSMTHQVRIQESQVFGDNPEVTRIGYYLRRLKIDEMPQIFNVLKGDMSIVGPRPCLPVTVEKYDLDTDYRFRVKPGLSSIAGVNGSIYLSWEDKWKYDEYYVKNLSLWLDIRIILKTFLVIIFGEKRFLNKPDY
jgi:lipopolysaccharide/colanic/teichoic acid biosynthesis glycosyltransferase